MLNSLLPAMQQLLTHNYATRGFWGDEAWTAVISQLPLAQIIEVTGQDFHPPFYYLLVHGFIQIFGNSEWIRVLSTVFFILTLWPTYKLAKKLVGKTFAWVGTVLVAFSPILLIYAFEARSYGLLTMMSVATTYFFWHAIQEKKLKWWILYTLMAGVGVYTHYYLWFIFASHGLFWLVMKRDQFWRVFASYFAVLLIQLPWIPTLFSQVKTVVGDYWIGAINSRTHWEYFMRTSAGDFVTKWQAPVAKLALAGVGLSLVAVWLKGQAKMGRKQGCRLPEGYILLWFWWLVPVILPSLISFIKPVFFYRYLVFTSVPIIFILLWGAQVVKKELIYLVGGLLLVAYLRTDWAIFNDYPHSMREEVATVFASQTPPNEERAVYTYLPSFAEVYFYVQTQAPMKSGQIGTSLPVKVIPEGLVQFSGRSLLDKYIELGLVEIKSPAEDETHWLLEPGPKSQFVE